MEKVRSGGRKEVKCKELNKKLLKNYDSQKRIFELLPSLLLFPIMDCCHSFSPKCKLIFQATHGKGKGMQTHLPHLSCWWYSCG